MIITRTPLRVSLFGGGTDYPSYYREAPAGGATIGFALDKYVYLTVRHLPPFHEHRVRLVYSRIELVDRATQLAHPAARAVLTELDRDTAIEVTHAADLPARSGLGSSSSFVVGLINAIDALAERLRPPMVLAAEAIRIERRVMHETGGEQDQIFAAFGDFLRINFGPTGTAVYRIGQSPRIRLLLDHLMLAFTGEARDAPTVSATLDLDPASPYLARMRAQVDEAHAIITHGARPIEEIGGLLNEAWEMKQRLSPAVTTPRVAALYERARSAGALGGKLLGAGGGGFLLLFVRPDDQIRVRAALPHLVFIPVGIDRYGSTVVANGFE